MDARNFNPERFRKPSMVRMLCSVHEALALVLVENSVKADFHCSILSSGELSSVRREDALRCAVAFADLAGVKEFHTRNWNMELEDGSILPLEILAQMGEEKMVRLPQGDAPVLCLGELID